MTFRAYRKRRRETHVFLLCLKRSPASKASQVASRGTYENEEVDKNLAIKKIVAYSESRRVFFGHRRLASRSRL